jgi:hypothetical protein
VCAKIGKQLFLESFLLKFNMIACSDKPIELSRHGNRQVRGAFRSGGFLLLLFFARQRKVTDER